MEPDYTPQDIARRVRERFLAEASKLADETDAKAVAAELIKDLNSQKRAVALRLLGMEDKWGRWEIDHCNQRKSTITEMLDAEVVGLVRQWVNDAVEEVITEELKTSTKNKVKTAIRGAIKQLVDDHTGHYKTYDIAKGVVAGLVSEASSEIKAELGLKS